MQPDYHPLPWAEIPKGESYDGEYDLEEDYILHACNAYPKLVEYAKLGISELTSERAERLVFEVEAYLKQLGEL